MRVQVNLAGLGQLVFAHCFHRFDPKPRTSVERMVASASHFSDPRIDGRFSRQSSASIREVVQLHVLTDDRRN